MSESNFWVVWCPENGNPTFKHDTEDSAEREAERLAQQNPGQSFHVLENKGRCRKNDVIWSRPGKDDVPF